jgi:hypothetical protein
MNSLYDCFGYSMFPAFKAPGPMILDDEVPFMKCPYCGKTIADNSVVCIFCEKMLKTPVQPAGLPGTPPFSAAPASLQDTQRVCPPPPSPVSCPPPRPMQPEQTDYLGSRLSDPPLSIGGFIGTLVVSFLPLAGLIVLLVWICGAKTNANRRNLSVALLILKLIVLFFFCGAALSFYLLKLPFFYYFW